MTVVGAAEPLIGESLVATEAQAAALAEQMLAEADRLWRSGHWRTTVRTRAVWVEAKPITGALAAAGLSLTRASGEIAAPAEAVFELLTSTRGYAVIDPYSDPRDHARPPLARYPWRPAARLEAALATANPPGMRPREFVVLNAIAPEARVFASKSILHPACPGGSAHSGERSPASGRVRALNTFALQVTAIDIDRCEVHSLNYADLGGRFPRWAMEGFNTRLFYPALFGRLAAAVRAA